MSTDGTDLIDPQAFVDKTLGPLSSHPDMMARQKRILWWLGMSPFLVGIVATLVILTGYRASYFASVHDWQSFLSACAIWWGKIKWSILVLALAGCVSAGFTLMLNLMWMVGATLGNVWRKGEMVSERDSLPFPVWFVVVGAFVWMIPVGTWAMRHALVAVDWRLNLAVQLASNFLCLFPMAVLLVWTKWARRPVEPGKDEVIRRPLSHFVTAMALFAACAVVFVSEKPDFFNHAIAKWFPWLAQCGIDADRAYAWVRLSLALILGIGGAFHFIVWRLRTEIRPKTKRREQPDANADGKSADAEKHDPNVIPAGASQLLANLPPGVTAEAAGPHGESVWRRKVTDQSPFLLQGGDEYGLRYLMGGDKTPTKDQVDFFKRFVKSFNDARKEFGERTDFREIPNREDSKRADILLMGEDGTGRTEILLAAALYAVVVRGQRVLYLCADPGGAEKLAKRASKRLEWLGIDVYVSADELKGNGLDRWLDPMSGAIPPELLFSTPESAEKLFFANPSTRKHEAAAEMRALLTGFGTVFVDDMLEMSPSFRAHTAFILDKLKLLQAAEPVLSQYVVAVTPLQKPDGVEAFGKRLFGVSGFDRKNNVLELKPRPCKDYWFGTLRVARGEEGADDRSLDKTVKELIRISREGGCRTLLYQKGMSADAKAKFLDDFGGKDPSGVSVASRFRELAELDDSPDNVFYLSLACGDAGTALRLNLDGGDPVFFRIALEGERDPELPRQYGLVPNETALSLRIHHLRNVLQFIDDHVPVPDEAWARFQITMNHPCIRALTLGASPGTVAVSWLHDEMVGDDAYGADVLWPYLILETPVAYGSGMSVDFNMLSDDQGTIWKDVKGRGRLLLADAEEQKESREPAHLALWRYGSQTLGESDLSHSDELVYVGADEFTVADAVKPESEESGRYAVLFHGQYRHAGDAEFINPVRRLSWKISLGQLKVPGVQILDEVATLTVERKSSSTCRVDGTLLGIANLMGKTNGFGEDEDELSYSYRAYLSCFVLLPSFDTGAGSKKSQAEACLDGAWETNASGGFSSALTHAFAATLRRKIADWPFFVIAPVFLTEGREDSIGTATMWLVEPSNSGRTMFPLLRRLMQESSEFRQELYAEAKETLESCENLQELRLASRLAFDGETLEKAEKQQALDVLGTLLSHERSQEWMTRRLREREEERKKRKERKAKSRSSGTYTPEEREFDQIVVDALKRFVKTIDVSKFAVELGWDYNKISDLFNDVLWNHPEVFWVSKCGRHHWWKNSEGKITRYVITDLPYAFGLEDHPQKKAELEAAVGKALGAVPSEADDVTKALRLHDYIVGNCEYDMESKNRHDQSPLARTAYSALVRGKAVCEGYAMAYRYLLSRVGIESEEVLSDSMNHCWNYVRLGENWYHVDVTWDDPVYQGRKPDDGQISREYFLLSDEAIRAKEHHDWDVRGLPPATDTTYDKRDWNRPRTDGGEDGGDTTESDSREKSRNRLRSGVSWKEYKDHFLFQMKGRGNVKKCCGKVHLRVFFVDDGNSAWDDSSRTTYREILNGISTRLEREGRASGAAIKVSWSTENRSISQSIQRDHVRQDALGKSKRSRKKEPDDWLYEALGVADDAAVATAQNDFKRDNGYDEAPIVFVFNKDFRSTARCSKSSSRRPCGEWTMISLEDNLYENPDRVRKVLLHELLHLFGAEDLYYHPAVKEAAERFLPDSVMSDGDSIDDLTRVLIGWDETLSANAIAFLNAIKDVSEKEFNDAHKEETKKKWH